MFNSLQPHRLYCTRLLLTMGFSRREYWSGLTCLPPGDLPDPGIEPTSSMLPAPSSGFFTTSTTWEDLNQAVLAAFQYGSSQVGPRADWTL